MPVTVTQRQTLSTQAAAEIRAMLGRLQVRQSHLARRLGENEQWVSTRLRGSTPLGLNDLERIADALDVPLLALLPRHVREAKTTAHYSAPAEKTMLVRSIVPAAAERMTGRATPTQSTRQPDNGSRRVARLVTKP